MKLVSSSRSRFQIAKVNHDFCRALPKVFTYTDWQPCVVYPKILRLVSRTNTKIFVGNGLHENEEWIDITSKVRQSTVIVL
jgi:hypothetical protein